MIDPGADKRLLLARSGMCVGTCDDRMIVATLPMLAGKMHLHSLAIGLPAPKREFSFSLPMLMLKPASLRRARRSLP